MKKHYLVTSFAIVSLLALSACGDNTSDQTSASAVDNEPDTTEETTLTEEAEDPVEEEVIDEAVEEVNSEPEQEGRLHEVGDVVKDESGTHTLLAVNNESHIIEVEGVILDFKEVKHVRVNPTEEAYEDMFYKYSSNSDEVDIIQIRVDLNNTSDINVRVNAIDVVVSSSGSQLNYSNNLTFTHSELDETYYNGVSAEGLYQFVLPDGPADIDWVEIYTDSFFEVTLDSYQTLSGKEKLKIEF